MEAMLFPEWREERKHLSQALRLRATRKLRMLSGNALEVLPSLLQELQGPALVLHSYCMGQWFAQAQGKLDEMFREASREREIHRIGVEVPGVEPPEVVRARLAALIRARIPLQQKSLPARIEYTRYAEGDGRTDLLGYADGFGAWIEWRGLGCRPYTR